MFGISIYPVLYEILSLCIIILMIAAINGLMDLLIC